MKKFFNLLISLIILLASFSHERLTTQAEETKTLIVHYHRLDDNYDGWNLWIWPEGGDGSSYAFNENDDYGVKTTLNFDSKSDTVGIIVRLNEWELKDIDVDRFVDLKTGITEIYLLENDPNIYTDKPEVDSSSPTTTPNLMSSSSVKVNIHYKRYDNTYTGWNLWLWLEGKDGKAYNFSSKDAYGMVLSTTFDLSATDLKLGVIVRLNEWQAKDVDSDRYINLTRAKNGVLDVYLLQGDANIYYNQADIDLSPKFLSASLDSIDMISVKTTQPIDLSQGDELEKLSLINAFGEKLDLRLFYAKEGMGVSSSSNFSLFTTDALDLSTSYTLNYPGYDPIDVIFKSVFSSDAFEEQFTTTESLGHLYTKESTEFKLWAPTASKVSVNLYQTGHTDALYQIDETSSFEMIRKDHGVWTLTLNHDLNGVYYTYTVEVNGKAQEAVDPYAKAVGVNGLRAMVVDLSTTHPEGWENDTWVNLEHSTDAIIYELHIRDFSSDLSSGILEDYQGKFLAFTQEGSLSPNGYSTGIDYLKDLGITHVHLLPSFDYRSIDETTLDKNTFNWGYDPQHFNVPEGSYSTDPYNGAVRINEFKQMVMALHNAGIGVVMDVVYNHTGASDTSDFSKVVPGYYYRYNANGTYSNGSGTGNETASDRSMVAEYMIDSLEYWLTEYHIDGFRFDLMALHDIETMNRIESTLRTLNPSVLIYGEGWTGGSSPLPDTEKALKKNVSFLNNIAVFSDDIRDALKGHVFTPTDPGFVNGGLGLKESVKFGIVASIKHPDVEMSSVKYTQTPYATSPTQIISYVEAHDNLTLWDKLLITNPEASDEERMAMHRLANAIVLTSQGTTFIHAGSEFLRTKDGNENSYNASDDINQLDWVRRETYDANVEYIKGLIALRTEHPAFRMTSAEDIQTHLNFIETEDTNVIAYTLDDHANDDAWENILVVMNANTDAITLDLAEGKWVVVANESQTGTQKLSTVSGSAITLAASSLMVLVDQKSIDPISYYLPYGLGFLALSIALFYFYQKRKKVH